MALGAACVLAAAKLAHAASETHTLDSFETLSAWRADHTDDTRASLDSIDGKFGRALRLNFDLAGVIGYATARRELPLDLPPNYELSFWMRGDAPPNTLQFKLVDASGENVWWINRPDFAFPHQWQQIRIKKRQLQFAWGPAQERELTHSAKLEFVIATGSGGGEGHVDIDQLTLRELPVDTGVHPMPIAHASSSVSAPAQAAFAEHPAAPWCSNPKRGAQQMFDIDLREAREFGGLMLDWKSGFGATRYDVQFSDDAKQWRTVRSVTQGNGRRDPLLLTESETRYIRLALHGGEADRYCLAHVTVEDLAWGATPNAFFAALAHDAPRGDYPRGFLEQPYWTIVGVDGGAAPALMSEDGALEPVKGGYSIVPFVRIDGKLLSWADVTTQQSLHDGYLPMPRVVWKSAQVELAIDAFADGDRRNAHLLASYRVTNISDQTKDITLALALRPFQVNPPAQFLNSPGGVSSITQFGWDGAHVVINGRDAVMPLTPPERFVARAFDAGSIVDALRERTLPAQTTMAVHDDIGYASAALVYALRLDAHASREVTLLAAMTDSAALTDTREQLALQFHTRREQVAALWRERLNRLKVTLPPSAQRIADALRSAHADILMSRDGAALRPGTRSYARSWIRDGAMIADALLRLGDLDAVRDYVQWYAPRQFANGKVPCCVDTRGADPVPENDSQGELIHAIAQLYRFGRDRVLLGRQFAAVASAVRYMDTLRASETGAADPAFKGLMPASISHEGYSAKPMHSYWDDFWALTGFNDAVEIAQALNKRDDVAHFAQSRDAFRRDLLASIALAVKSHAIDFIPGCAELGDFDATSTTLALSPAGVQQDLPMDLLQHTFERYWREFSARAGGSKTWNDYTPYEWRAVGAFVRLGWRERAQAAIRFLFDTGARPAGWNQWAEVVGRDARQIRFIGDMPHAWVASDFIRSVLDLFAYERESDHALVLAGGVPESWLSGNGIAIAGLRTPYGALGYSLRRERGRLLLHVDAGAAPPGGFVFMWPLESAPGGTRINAKRVVWQGRELRFASAPATAIVSIDENPN